MLIDTRPAKDGWHPGNYINTCAPCGNTFVGSKGSCQCAKCAYGETEKEAANRAALLQPVAGGRYRGQWTPHYGKFPSREELAVLEGDFFVCICDGQIDNVQFKAGDYLIAVRDDPSDRFYSDSWRVMRLNLDPLNPILAGLGLRR